MIENNRTGASKIYSDFAILTFHEVRQVCHLPLRLNTPVPRCSAVNRLFERIDGNVDIVTADGAYDKNKVYDSLTNKFENVMVVISSHCNLIYNVKNHSQRNRNYQEIKTFCPINW